MKLYATRWTGTQWEVHSHECTPTKSLYRFKGRTGLAFECRLQVRKDDAKHLCIGLSAAEAIRLRRESLLRESADLMRRVDAAVRKRKALDSAVFA